MEVTRTYLDEQLAAIAQQMTQLQAQANQLSGAKAAFELAIKRLEAEEPALAEGSVSETKE